MGTTYVYICLNKYIEDDDKTEQKQLNDKVYSYYLHTNFLSQLERVFSVLSCVLCNQLNRLASALTFFSVDFNEKRSICIPGANKQAVL